MSFRREVDRRLASLALSPQMQATILANAVRARPVPKKRKPRAGIIALAACLTFVFGLSVAAGAIPAFETFLGHMGNDLRQLLQPINKMDSDNGIRMDVVAAVNDGHAAVVYLTLQDLENKGRVDDTTQLTEVTANSRFGGFERQVHYDTETGTATFRLEQLYPERANGQKVTLQLQSFVSGVEYQPATDIGLTVADVVDIHPEPVAAGTMDKDTGYGFHYGFTEDAQQINEDMVNILDNGTMPILEPGGGEYETTPEWAGLSNAGIVDGYLHLQQKTGEDAAFFNSVEYLLQVPGYAEEERLPSASLNLGEVTERGSHHVGEYTENVLALPENVDYSDIQILAQGVTCNTLVEGRWEVAFTLDEDVAKKAANCQIQRDAWTVTQVTVSPISVTLSIRGEFTEQGDFPEVQVFLQDGTLVDSSGSTASIYNEDDTFLNKYCFDRPIDIDQLEKVIVNGETIDFGASSP